MKTWLHRPEKDETCFGMWSPCAGCDGLKCSPEIHIHIEAPSLWKPYETTVYGACSEECAMKFVSERRADLEEAGVPA